MPAIPTLAYTAVSQVFRRGRSSTEQRRASAPKGNAAKHESSQVQAALAEAGVSRPSSLFTRLHSIIQPSLYQFVPVVRSFSFKPPLCLIRFLPIVRSIDIRSPKEQWSRVSSRSLHEERRECRGTQCARGSSFTKVERLARAASGVNLQATIGPCTWVGASQIVTCYRPKPAVCRITGEESKG